MECVWTWEAPCQELCISCLSVQPSTARGLHLSASVQIPFRYVQFPVAFCRSRFHTSLLKPPLMSFAQPVPRADKDFLLQRIPPFTQKLSDNHLFSSRDIGFHITADRTAYSLPATRLQHELRGHQLMQGTWWEKQRYEQSCQVLQHPQPAPRLGCRYCCSSSQPDSQDCAGAKKALLIFALTL